MFETKISSVTPKLVLTEVILDTPGIFIIFKSLVIKFIENNSCDK